MAGGRYDAARFSAAVAVAGITIGWGVAQHPALLPGRLTVTQAAAPHATLVGQVQDVQGKIKIFNATEVLGASTAAAVQDAQTWLIGTAQDDAADDPPEDGAPGTDAAPSAS